MRTAALFTCLALAAASSGTIAFAQEAKPDPKPAKPAITVSKETTWATEPLDAEGRVDYAGFLNQHFSRGVSPETNAVVELYHVWGPRPDGSQQPDEFFTLLGMQPPPEEAVYLIDYHRWLGQHPEVEFPADQRDKLIREGQDLCGRRPWKATEYPQVAAWLKHMDAPLNRAVLATERPQYYSPLIVRKNAAGKSEGLIGVLLPGVQASRGVARALCARAMLKLGEGQTLDAWKDLMACHRLGRLIGRGPTLIESLVGVAIEAMSIEAELRVLGESKQAPKLVAGFRRMLQTLPPRSPMSEKINYAERCMFHDSMTLVATGQIALGALVGNGDDSTFSKILTGTAMQFVDWNVVLKKGNQHYDKLHEAFQVPSGPARTAAIAQRDQELREINERSRNPANSALALVGGKQFLTDFAADVAIGLLFPGITSVVKAEDRIEQRWRTLDVALALSAYHQDQQSYPESLDQLLPKYLPAAPTDIFRDKPLLYERTADGYRCYSLGPNQTDDQGRTTDDTPAGDDIIIRMPLPAVALKP